MKIVPIGNSKHTLYNQARAQLETDNHDQIVALLTLWLNRILFLKLFESQLVSFNNGAEEYKFFNSQKVKDANDLGTLFFFVLSTPVKDRIMDDLLENIPFLNSSLFERSPKENKFPVSAVLKEKLPLYPHSVLKDNKSRSFVTYILDFLDSYNFCETEEEDTRELISSSVLGLVFEKINGYKDGAFFTPSLVTEFMAKDVIDRVVLDKFNKIFQERAQCKNIEELENLLGYDRHKTERKKIYQATFDSIKICDPSCGSGHFLVSVLNYLVYLKSFLGLLPISNNIEIHNDLLFIADSTSTKQFKYLRGDVSTTEVQKVIFKTKAHLIKNCLFGADINAASVEICKLRLWIELLKNAYYIDNTEEMELLPNIDLNIVCGDSLSSMPHPGISTSLFVDPETVKKYKELFSDYRNGNYKKGKYADRDSLSVIKAELSEACSLTALNNFPVQWTIEFPDVLGKNGEFSGFDVVIGNPPYIQLQKDEGKLGKIYSKGSFVTFERKGDIYCLFFERSFYLLKEDGYLSFITSNKWLKADYGKKLRLFLSKADPQVLVDFKNLKIFDNASVDTSILVLKKSSSSEGTNSLVVNSEEELRNLPLLLDTNQNIIYFSNRGEEKWIILEPFEKSIFSKIQRLGVRLKTQGLTIQLGIKTGYKKAFIISTETKQAILDGCKSLEERENTEKIFCKVVDGKEISKGSFQWRGSWLVNTHNGIKEDSLDPIDVSNYPSLKNFLDRFYSHLEDRNDKGETPYNLRDCNYINSFLGPKIIYPDLFQTGDFVFTDEPIYLTNTAYLIFGKDQKILQNLTKYLNSKTMQWYFKKENPQLGSSAVRMYKSSMEEIPILEDLNFLTGIEDKDTIETLIMEKFGFTSEEKNFVLNQ